MTPIHGRIRISKEGINGVLSGLYNDLYQYEQQLRMKLSRLLPSSSSSSSSSQLQQTPQHQHDNMTSRMNSSDYFNDFMNNKSNRNNDDYELDVKYCFLRHDISIELQLFHDLIIQETKQVVNLVDAPIIEDDDRANRIVAEETNHSSHTTKQKNMKKKNGYSSRR
jgi:hypothetical protein